MNETKRRWGLQALALALIAGLLTLGVGTTLASGLYPGGGAGRGGMMGDVDQHFITMMIPHHDGAIAMADLALGTDRNGQPRSQHQEILDLSARITVTQAQEIATMRTWYQAWYGAAVPTVTGTMGMMGGAMGDADLETLRGLSGDAFDRAFIEAMVPHHQMAVMMSQMALTGAQHQELRALLQTIIAGQSAEIADMQQWYQHWYGQAVPAGNHGMGAMPNGAGPMHGPGGGMPRHWR